MTRKKKASAPKSKSHSRIPVISNAGESAEHSRLKTVLKEIIGTSGLRVDTEVHLNFSGNCDEKGALVDECSIDVAGYGRGDNGKPFLIIFECKGGGNFREPLKKMSAWESNIDKIKNGKSKVVSSDAKLLKKRDFDTFEEIRVCYVFGKNMEKTKYEQIASTLKAGKFYAWDNHALTYYKKDAGTIGKAIKNEILKEFRVGFELSASFHEKAIKLKQGALEMFMFGANPSVILRVAYVSRRAA